MTCSADQWYSLPVALGPHQLCISAKRRWDTWFYIDYRKVNAVTRKDAYPLPHVDDTLDTLSGSKWLSTLDLLSGYWQVEVSPEDQEKNCILHT